jgi:hypothetical protein
MLSAGWRKLVLLLHVTTSVGMLGAVAAFLVLALSGAAGDAGAYPAMQLVTWPVIVPLMGASLLIGIVSSLTTPWGLLRYWWLVAKLVATLIAGGVLLLQTRTIDALAAASPAMLPQMASGRAAMILHSAGGLAVLLAVMVLSIYKPRGLTGLSV